VNDLDLVDDIARLFEREAAVFDLAIAKVIQLGRLPSEVVAVVDSVGLRMATRERLARLFVEILPQVERCLRRPPRSGTRWVLLSILIRLR
jgi:hypothetical protein